MSEPSHNDDTVDESINRVLAAEHEALEAVKVCRRMRRLARLGYLRPIPARWFEVLIPRLDSVVATGTLARTGLVELELGDGRGGAFTLEGLEPGLAHYRELFSRYGSYWGGGRLTHSTHSAPPQAVLGHALSRIYAWRAQADPVIRRLQILETEVAELELWERVLGCGAERGLDIDFLGRCGPVLAALLAILPPDVALEPPAPALTLSVRQAYGRCLLVIGPTEVLRAFRHEVRLAKGRLLQWPEWLRGGVAKPLEQVRSRLELRRPEVDRYYRELDGLYRGFALGEALGDLARLAWFQEQVGALPASLQLAWITGWTSDPDGSTLRAALERDGVRALLRLAPPPPGAHPPQLLHNPGWVRPFEVFAKALGVPGSKEVDPSPVLAVIVPLLFGYMFGDLGQGMVLLALGWLLQHRWSLARLLIPAGLSAALFGLLFGSVFSREDLLPALWLNPLRDPVTVMAVPLALAVLLLTLGQLLNALEAAWRGQLRRWWLAGAGFLVLYVGAAASFLDPSLWMLALIGLAWHLAGRFWLKPTLRGALGALGSLAEDGLRLFVNTVSFARVGAFALAHAGLSSALATLAYATTSVVTGLIIMVLGNVVIIALEALVVSVQTTRLVLFEFFTRFLRAEGRRFQPLAPPPTMIQGDSHEVTG